MSIIGGHGIFHPDWDTMKLVLEQSIKSELSSLRDYVDQRLNAIDQRIDELHAQVSGGGKTGPAIYTELILENLSDESLAHYQQHNWYGSGNFPQIIHRRMSAEIKHEADSGTGCSKGGVAYTIRDNIRWIVAWSNMKDKENKVYIDVIETDGSIDWDVYGSLLDTSKPKPNAVNKYWNRAVASIDPSSVTPLMKATLAAAIR
ncbi:hypothetical protein GQ457_09G027110 [Hibiscus cannabinus]